MGEIIWCQPFSDGFSLHINYVDIEEFTGYTPELKAYRLKVSRELYDSLKDKLGVRFFTKSGPKSRGYNPEYAFSEN